MPTYQYACTACDERLEVVQKFSDDPLTVCTVCGGRLRKLFSAVGIVFKGSGFYRTDSRSDGRTGPVSAGEKDSKPNGSAPGASADSGSSSGEGKAEKKAEAAGASTSSSADTKVA